MAHDKATVVFQRTPETKRAFRLMRRIREFIYFVLGEHRALPAPFPDISRLARWRLILTTLMFFNIRIEIGEHIPPFQAVYIYLNDQKISEFGLLIHEDMVAPLEAVHDANLDTIIVILLSGDFYTVQDILDMEEPLQDFTDRKMVECALNEAYAVLKVHGAL